MSTRAPTLYCHNCGQDLSGFHILFSRYDRHQTVRYGGGVTVITDEVDGELHRCAPFASLERQL